VYSSISSYIDGILLTIYLSNIHLNIIVSSGRYRDGFHQNYVPVTKMLPEKKLPFLQREADCSTPFVLLIAASRKAICVYSAKQHNTKLCGLSP
jgi:hypothetical protein